MARADLLISLARSGSKGDQVQFRRTLESLIAEERAKRHHVLADRLAEYLRQNGDAGSSSPLGAEDQRLLFEINPERSFADLILPPRVVRDCTELVEEQHRSDLLRSHNLEPRHRVFLAGPPGNGKTSLAEAIATALALPLFVVRYEGIIGSFLGETAQRLSRLFDLVRTRQCVLFFDEFDAIGKERGDEHETGEVKRVVSSLLLQMDALPSYVVVVMASNHPELLDRAVWRRFQLRLEMPSPTSSEAAEWFHRFQRESGLSLGHSPEQLAKELKGASFSELEEFSLGIMRRHVLAAPIDDLRQIVSDKLDSYRERFATPR